MTPATLAAPCQCVNEQPVYAIVDGRADGRHRIVAELTDVIAALAWAARLRSEGADASVHLLAGTGFDGENP